MPTTWREPPGARALGAEHLGDPAQVLAYVVVNGARRNGRLQTRLWPRAP